MEYVAEFSTGVKYHFAPVQDRQEITLFGGRKINAEESGMDKNNKNYSYHRWEQADAEVISQKLEEIEQAHGLTHIYPRNLIHMNDIYNIHHDNFNRENTWMYTYILGMFIYKQLEGGSPLTCAVL